MRAVFLIPYMYQRHRPMPVLLSFVSLFLIVFARTYNALIFSNSCLFLRLLLHRISTGDRPRCVVLQVNTPYLCKLSLSGF